MEKNIFKPENLPQLKIYAPQNNQTILGDKVTLSFIVGKANFNDIHLHLWLDNPVQAASTASEITTHFDQVLTEIREGSHVLSLEVVQADHASFILPIKESVLFKTVFPPGENLSPFSPSTSLNLTNPTIDYRIIILLLAVVLISLGIFLRKIF
ncbi:hypothetical protein A2960_06040 [Candidatus Gottesmanbacteria bacterium RIFCSPLOWO2_01_FULL_39_12b]|uniref:Uncharacterized protein n=1 Tax=Candidatus Gottesmanbacteria bacterium RIFCSPLOWO2_01_FULL_39_12b TaxID=1798388 RepID=A0A1F6ANX5_9BACT|nr:MAG: hypothetical protein A2960_06040 [Candidatus Gottesmanbacteria bacterium RIFCSPLOWO2_01_FULL_39_12b]